MYGVPGKAMTAGSVFDGTAGFGGRSSRSCKANLLERFGLMAELFARRTVLPCDDEPTVMQRGFRVSRAGLEQGGLTEG